MLYPNWVTDETLSDDEREQKRISFLLKLAALHYSEANSLKELATGMCVSPQTLVDSVSSGKCTPGLASNVESTVGRDVCPREELCSLFK